MFQLRILISVLAGYIYNHADPEEIMDQLDYIIGGYACIVMLMQEHVVLAYS